MDTSSDENTIIGKRYRVVSTTGGGMAVVYFCLDLLQENFPVALKTFKPEYLPNREFRDRFLREAQIWVDLEFHPNIVQAYRTERFEPGNEVFLVLELIPTQPGKQDPSLRSWLIPGQPLSSDRSFQIASGVIRGMKYAVEKIPGLVHRDLKPENILIAPDGTPRIADFGLASVTKGQQFIPSRSGSRLRSRLTKGLVGTPLYISPEQWAGSEADERSDIYAFGCIFFEMLTGQFAVHGSSVDELAQAHTSGEAMRTLAGAGITKSLHTFLTKCLHLQSSSRHPSWDQAEIALQAVIDEVSPGFSYPDEVSIDVSQFNRLQKASSYLAIGSAYLDLGKFEVGKDFFQQAYVIGKDVGEQHLTGFALANIGVANADAGKYQEAIEYYQQAIDLQLEIGDDYQAGMNFGNLGNAFFGLYDLQRAKLYLEKAYQLAEEIGDLQNQARWKGNLGNLYLASGEFRRALDLFQSSIDISRSIGDRVIECSSLGGAGQAYEYLGNQNKAIEHYRLATAIAEKIGDRQFQGVSLLNIGSLMSKMNQLPLALSCIQQSLDISHEIGDRLLQAKSLGNMGTVLILSGELDQAVRILEEAVNRANEINARDVVARANWSLGLIYEFKREFNKAIKHLRTAVVAYKTLGMPEYTQASEHLVTLRKQLGLL